MKKLASVLLLAALSAAAQEPVPALVQVDLLLFRHATTSPEQAGAIAALPSRPGDVIQASVELFAPSTGAATAGNKENAVRLVASPGKLNAALKKLGNSENFELLHQVSWQQPVYDPQNALHVALVPARRGGLLKGSAKLSFDRYFQLAMTLLYEPGFPDAEPSEQNSPASDTVFIHLKETMTDNKLYYLDHPLLGVLAQITVLTAARPGDAGP